MPASQTLQQQLNDLTEKYNALQQRAKYLELEKEEYARDLKNYRFKDCELELTLKELSKKKTETEQRHSLICNERASNVQMLETEYATNQQLRFTLQGHLTKINKLSKEIETIKQINKKYEIALIKLEKENKNKAKLHQQQMTENQFLMTEIQLLQSELADHYKTASPATVATAIATVPEFEVEAPLLPSEPTQFLNLNRTLPNLKTHDIALELCDLGPSIGTNYSTDSNLEFVSRRNTVSVRWSDMDNNVERSVSSRFERYKRLKSDSNVNDKLLEEAMNKQRIEYEVLLQALNAEKEELRSNVKMLNDEMKKLFESNNRYIERGEWICGENKNVKKSGEKKYSGKGFLVDTLYR